MGKDQFGKGLRLGEVLGGFFINGGSDATLQHADIGPFIRGSDVVPYLLKKIFNPTLVKKRF